MSTKNWFEKIADEFRHQPLGATYYLFSILVALAGMAGIVIKFFALNDPSEAIPRYFWIALIVFVVLAVVIVPLLILRILKARDSEPARVKVVVASVMQPTAEYRYQPNAFL